MTKWIDIKDELPPKGVNILTTYHIYGEFRDAETGTWEGDKTMGEAIAIDSYSCPDGEDFIPCTHWMRIPDLPKI